MELGALGRRRRRGGAFSIASLFANGEAGAWYDPSDLTAEKVAWRRNLLTYTEQFDNAAWTKTGAAITANATSAPDGTTTADTLIEDTSTGYHRIAYSITQLNNSTFSVYAKLASGTRTLDVNHGGRQAAFDLTGTGSVVVQGGSGTTGTASIFSVGNGWYRCSVSLVSSVQTNQVWLGLSQATGASFGNSYTGDGTSGIYLWGAQLEVGSTATSYQRITNFTSDFLAAFPTHGLYQDAAGTTPVTALGQPVGLALDQSRGGLANLGPNIQNGGFDSDTVWTKNGWTISGGSASYATGAGAAITQVSPVTLAVGDMVRVTVTISAITSGFVYAWVAGGNTSALGSNATRTNSVGTYTWYFPISTVVDQTVGIYCANGPSGIVIDNVSIRRVPGVHAIQPTSASRPLLDGRVNLLTYSEQFDGAGWSKSSVTVSANAAMAPDGTTTADLVYPSSSGSLRIIYQATSAASAIYTRSVYAKASGKTVFYIDASGGSPLAYFNLANGTVSNVAANHTATITSVGNGWYRCTVTSTAPASVSFGGVYGPADAAGSQSVTANGTDGVLFWGADIRLAADAAYPYQRVAAATDYADVGVPRAFAFDGFDDSLYTAANLDLSGTDKVTVVAGVRKNDNTNAQIIAETSTNPAANNGSFYCVTNSDSAGNVLSAAYAVQVRGTSNAGAGAAGTTAPISNVVAGRFNIAAAADAAVLRVNGAQVATSGAASAGTGNFGSYVLFIGRRNNTSLSFNGKAYQLIVRGALTDAATLAQAERYVGAKTGVTIP